MVRLSHRALAVLAAVFFVSTVVLGISLGATWVYVARLLQKPAPKPGPVRARLAPVSPLLLQYTLDLPGRGEIFPALVGSSAAEYWPVAVLTVTNASDRPVLVTISAEVRDWTRPSIITAVIGPREARPVRLNPELLPAAYSNSEVRRATLSVRVAAPNGETLFADTRPVLLHSGAELFWGQKFANAQYVVRWITPHDPAVMRLVSQARQYLPRGRLGGYNFPPEATPAAMKRQVRQQAEAVFRALKRSGISYVSSIFVYGEFINQAQRIRLPSETLQLSNANCMDVSVLFASAIENLGMRPVVIIVPGHAFVGVRYGPDSTETLYLDLTVLPQGSFAAAEKRAQEWLQKTDNEHQLMVDVAAARALGIYPLPEQNATSPVAGDAAAPSPGAKAAAPGAEPAPGGARPASAQFVQTSDAAVNFFLPCAGGTSNPCAVRAASS